MIEPAGDSARRCARCKTTLAADNTASLCGKCHRELSDQFREPPAQLRNEFFETDEFRSAFDSHHMGLVCKAYRNHPRHLKLFGKALSQEILGQWLGLNQGQVSKFENGKPEQNMKTLQHYATILHLPHDMLWFAFPGESLFGPSRASGNTQGQVTGYADLDRPNGSPDLRTDGAIHALITLAASESTEFGLGHDVSELNESSMEQIDEEVRRLSVDFVEGDPFGTFMRSRALRNNIFTLLDKRVFPRQERMLYAFAARTCGYLGAASSDFFGHYDAAADQCRVARQLSDVADTPELRAWALSLQSGIALWQGSLRQAADLADRAGQLAVTRSGVLRATSMHARALARLGDVERLRSIVRSSETGLTDNQSDDEKGMILFSEINYLRNLGTANLWAGKSLEAREQLAQALQHYLSEAAENFAVIATIRADLALSFLNLKDIEGAVEAISPVLEMEADRRLEGSFRRMREIRSILQKEYAGSLTGDDLSVQISTFLASSRRVVIYDDSANTRRQ